MALAALLDQHWIVVSPRQDGGWLAAKLVAGSDPRHPVGLRVYWQQPAPLCSELSRGATQTAYEADVAAAVAKLEALTGMGPWGPARGCPCDVGRPASRAA